MSLKQWTINPMLYFPIKVRDAMGYANKATISVYTHVVSDAHGPEDLFDF